MTHGICDQSMVPMRADSSHKSEMVSQLLFGEFFELLETREDWCRVKHSFDNYEGWILKKQCSPLNIMEYHHLASGHNFYSYDLVQLLLFENTLFSIVLGSLLPWFNSKQCKIGTKNYTFEGNARMPLPIEGSDSIIENAYMYLNAPYLWGGRSPFGIDCSGFTQMSYKLSGYKLKRDAAQQAEQGRIVNLLEETVPGDLAFFDNDEGKIVHTGILLNNNRIIHASGRVRIDNIDHHGIYNAEEKKYSHNLRLIKRII
jgi:hypothetical protein